jgi:hypothetical protein
VAGCTSEGVAGLAALTALELLDLRGNSVLLDAAVAAAAAVFAGLMTLCA